MSGFVIAAGGYPFAPTFGLRGMAAVLRPRPWARTEPPPRPLSLTEELRKRIAEAAPPEPPLLPRPAWVGLLGFAYLAASGMMSPKACASPAAAGSHGDHPGWHRQYEAATPPPAPFR